ncbi:MAG: hypothetical protein K9G67_12810 [Bacteroidales bacterium]|nr:hypothetical protein [Bacteroidales bacterium]MCF8377231.1 hypothetical protein [Bacteroidales bacterium]
MTVGIEQELSPIRFCFLIRPKNKADFRRAVEISHSLWGGIYNPILPLYKRFTVQQRKELRTHLNPPEFYSNFLLNFDPDIIVYEDSIDFEYIKDFVSDRILIKLSEIREQLESHSLEYGLSILHIISILLESEFKFARNDNLKFILPKTPPKDNHLIINSTKPISKYYEGIKSALEGKSFFETFEIKRDNIASFLNYPHLSIIDLNLFQIKTKRSIYHETEYIYCYDPNNFIDLIYLWNIRASGRKGLALPIGESLDNYNETFRKFYTNYNRNTSLGPNVIKGYSLEMNQFNEIADYISTFTRSKDEVISVVAQNWLPSFGETRETADYNGISSASLFHRVEYKQMNTSEGEHLRYDLIEPLFKTRSFGFEKFYKVRSKFHFLDNLCSFPNVLDGITGVDWSRLTHDIGDVRISRGGVVRISKVNSHASFFIPEAIEFLKTFFRKNNFTLVSGASNKLSKQIYKNLGGNYGIFPFMSKGALKVLEEFEGGKAVLNETLVASIKRNQPLHFESDAKRFIKVLLDCKIIELGVELHCEICQQRFFIHLNNIGNKVTCTTCRSTFEPPQNNPLKEFKWAYIGTGPYTNNNKIDGLFCSYFAIEFFKEAFAKMHDRLTVGMNFELKKNKQEIEIDLFLQLLQGGLNNDVPDTVFCECKTYKSFSQKDIDRLRLIGQNYPNSILTFCTLNDELSQEEIDLIIPLVEEFRKGTGNRPLNPVLILTANELLPDEKLRPLAHYGEIHLSVRVNDLLGYICDHSVHRYLGLELWSEIKLREWREFHQSRNN